MAGIFDAAKRLYDALGGHDVIVLGVGGFFGKLWGDWVLQRERQKDQRELERYKSEMEARLHGQRLHVAAEFGALNEVWRKSSEFQRAAKRVREHLEEAGKDKTPSHPDEELSERFLAAQRAFQDVKATIEDNSPFLNLDVMEKLMDAYEEAVETLKAARRSPSTLVPPLDEQAHQQVEEVITRSTAAVFAIRKRLRELGVEPQ